MKHLEHYQILTDKQHVFRSQYFMWNSTCTNCAQSCFVTGNQNNRLISLWWISQRPLIQFRIKGFWESYHIVESLAIYIILQHISHHKKTTIGGWRRELTLGGCTVRSFAGDGCRTAFVPNLFKWSAKQHALRHPSLRGWLCHLPEHRK